MKKILLIFVGILLSGFLVGCGEIEYRVHVVISGTEEPVENAQVTIDDIGTDITDGLGNAAIIVDSSYVGNAGRLTVRADDFEPYTLQIDLVEQDRPKEVPLRPIISEPLVIADFDSCAAANDLGGPMGAAYNPPDFLEEKYIDEPEHGCVARLEYDIKEWAAFWMKLQETDFSSYSNISFDIRSESGSDIPEQIKIELKRAGNQIGILYISNVTTDWQTMEVNLIDFGSAGFGNRLSSYTGMDELVFTFESNRSGNQGIVYLDNITLNP